MAIWQTSFMLESDFIIDISSNKYIDSLHQMEKALPRNSSWSDEMLLYGNLAETCVEIFLTVDTVDEIYVRIDLRNISIVQIQAILKFANINSMYIIFENQKYLANVDTIKEILKNSKSYCFLQNPQAFLCELEKQTIQD